MPITQKSIEVPVLTGAQAQVLREIYRISQLAEGIKSLESIDKLVESSVLRDNLTTAAHQSVQRISQYLTNQLNDALINVRTPLPKPVKLPPKPPVPTGTPTPPG